MIRVDLSQGFHAIVSVKMRDSRYRAEVHWYRPEDIGGYVVLYTTQYYEGEYDAKAYAALWLANDLLNKGEMV